MCLFMKNEMVCYEIQNDVNLQIELIGTSCSSVFIKALRLLLEGDANSLPIIPPLLVLSPARLKLFCPK
jgi:hypothetical protein